jgi:hypothetical protein
MTKYSFNNDASPADRLAVHRNDERVHRGGTYHEIAIAEADAVGGRFAAASKQRVVGSGPFEYPQLPASSPWHRDPVPDEPPIGIDISAAPIVGEPHEVALSEARHGADTPAEPDDEALLGGDAPRCDTGFGPFSCVVSRAVAAFKIPQEKKAMKQSPEWYRQQSKLAEDKWQRAAWQPGADVTLKRKAPSPSPTEGFHPHQKGDSAPNSIAAAIYPHLAKRSE